MEPASGIESVAHVIQLSVAPVFLLTGIGSLLNVFSNRLSRIIDRTRALEARRTQSPGGSASAATLGELRLQDRRAGLIRWAISLAVLSALLVCGVVVVLFAGASWRIDASAAITPLFTLAMLVLIGALGCFLREIFVAILGLRETRE